jgi:hypothetical protein
MCRLIRLVLACSFFAFAPAALAEEIDDAIALYQSGDHDAAFEAFSGLVAQGNGEAIFYIGQMYENGQSKPQNYSNALRWYRRAAAQDHAEAHFKVGQMFENSVGVPRDFGAAFDAYSAAAALGHKDAELKMAEFYARGLGTYPDVTQAAELLGEAAQAGNQEAFDALVELWDSGQVPKGVLSDDIIARMDAVLAERRAEDSQIEYSEEEAAPVFDDSDTAAYLRNQIERILGNFASGAREQGGNFTYVLDITEDDDGRIVATVREMTALSTEGTWIIDDATLDLIPLDAGRYSVTASFPATSTFYDPSGNEIGGTVIGNQNLSGVFVPEINTWTSADGAFSDISLWADVPSEGLFRLDITKALLNMALDEPQPGKWSGPGSLEMSGLSATIEGQEIFRLGLMNTDFDYRLIDLVFFNRMNMTVQDIQERMAGMGEPSGTVMAEIQAMGAELIAFARERAPLLEGFEMSMTLSDFMVNDPDGDRFSMDAMNLGFGIDDADKDQGAITVAYGHSGLDFPLAAAVDDFMPHTVDIVLVMSELPLAETETMVLELIEGAIADPDAFEEQAEMAMMFMGLGLQQRMAEIGSTLHFERFELESDISSASMTGALTASAESPMMTVGQVRLEIQGLEDAMLRLEAMPNDMDAQGLTMMQAMGQRIEDGGVVTHIYDLELTPDGRTLLNGNDMSAMMGGMMAP